MDNDEKQRERQAGFLLNVRNASLRCAVAPCQVHEPCKMRPIKNKAKQQDENAFRSRCEHKSQIPSPFASQPQIKEEKCGHTVYFSGGVLFCCALVPGTLALVLPTLNLERLVFLSHCCL